jgi:hypothetical protein
MPDTPAAIDGFASTRISWIRAQFDDINRQSQTKVTYYLFPAPQLVQTRPRMLFDFFNRAVKIGTAA